MFQSITIFIAGVGGVFTGMALLYLAILLMPIITARLERQKDTE